jgi:hypothetical protein
MSVRRILSRALLGVLLAALLLGVLLAAAGYGIFRGVGGVHPHRGEIAPGPRPRIPRAEPQILFGDLHVHTTYSADAFLFSLPITMGEGVHPPADACDSARYCSALDFWSINDHAELLTPAQWERTIEAVRRCDAEAGDPADPDLVSFLGWEWTQMGATPEEHFGHKNVILRGLSDDEIPTRPISAGRGALDEGLRALGPVRVMMALGQPSKIQRYLDFNRALSLASDLDVCPEGVDVRALPPDCAEGAATPDLLFEKLAQWGFDTLVIPHGTSWGIHAPPRSSLAHQLAPGLHDPDRQRLFEVHSGHGTSERFHEFTHVEVDEAGNATCPAPTPGFTPCCWRAGELVRERCGDVPSEVCEARVEKVRREFASAGIDPKRFHLVPAAPAEAWGECGQPVGEFMPAYLYRPGMSAQQGLALGDFSQTGAPLRFRFGLIGSSDNHKARAGPGYKEFGRKAMTDAWGFSQGVLDGVVPEVEAAAEPLTLDQVPPARALLPERGASYYFSGGLVAVHAEGRGRDAIFDALVARQVYGTSGDRILLWFDLLADDGSRIPMGSEIAMEDTPHFEVRALGAFEQRPGCPEYAVRGLGPERLARLCLGECFHPGESRRRIERIEVVRIRPQKSAEEPLGALVEDPWRVFECDDRGDGCSVAFRDEEFVTAGRESVYYVRALQEPTDAVAGDPLRCERDAAGGCVTARPCFASGPEFDPDDECLAPVSERAWSSPIFVEPGDALDPGDALGVGGR